MKTKPTEYFALGLFFIIGCGLLWITYEYISGTSLNQEEGYTVTSTFDDIKTLKPGDDVRMAGVRIGKVSSVDLVKGKAQVNLLIEEKYPIYQGSVIKIISAGLLGSQYIAVDGEKANQQTIADGANLESRAVSDLNSVIEKIGDIGTKVDDALGSLSNVFGGDDGSPSLFTNINELVTENRSKIDNTLTNLENITAQLSSNQGTLGKLLNDEETYDSLKAIFADIQQASTKLNSFLDSANNVALRLDAGEGTLGKLLSDDSLSLKIDEAINNFVEFSESLNSEEGTIGKLVKDDELYQDVKAILTQAERTFNSVSDSGPVTAVSILSNTLF